MCSSMWRSLIESQVLFKRWWNLEKLCTYLCSLFLSIWYPSLLRNSTVQKPFSYVVPQPSTYRDRNPFHYNVHSLCCKKKLYICSYNLTLFLSTWREGYRELIFIGFMLLEQCNLNTKAIFTFLHDIYLKVSSTSKHSVARSDSFML